MELLDAQGGRVHHETTDALIIDAGESSVTLIVQQTQTAGEVSQRLGQVVAQQGRASDIFLRAVTACGVAPNHTSGTYPEQSSCVNLIPLLELLHMHHT